MPQLTENPGPEDPPTWKRWAAQGNHLVRRGLGHLSHPRVRRGVTLTLTVLAIVGLGTLLHNNWDTLRTFEWQFRPVPFLTSFLLYSLALGLAILAWGKMMTALGTQISWRTHIRVYSITNLARRLPGMLWYVAGRLVLYEEDKASRMAISVASALELVLIALSGLMIGVALWPGAISEFLNPLWIAGIVVLSLIAIHPKVIRIPLRWFGAEREHIAATQLRYGQVLIWLCLYGGVWLAGGFVLFALIQTVYPVSLTWLPQVIGAWSLSGMVSVVAAFLPVGLGLRELALGLLLAAFLPEGIAIIIALLARLLLTFYELLWALTVQRVKSK